MGGLRWRPGRDEAALAALLAAGNIAGAGLDGVVAPPRELERLRARLGPAPTIITPGIRDGAGQSGGDDQVRTLSAAEAVSAGATYIVVGRPIIASPDPLASAKAIVRQLEEQSAHNLKPEA